ncbi:MAG TPA: glycosyltransferase 87 family protein [Jatrophihabitans sp.]|uniref:glycosyltransferase 87 family protein n=1 Tax=Jatrophihabitans sp. TaxID=1932789 RepID=UPI002E00F91A|nr:glycosyltransferase 87 family protein [Jatrophihabitans sp.]
MPLSRSSAVVAALGLTLAAETAAYGALIRRTDVPHAQRLMLIATPLWVLAVWLLSRCRLSARGFTVVVLGASAVLHLVALTGRPSTSDDDYRYLWDGKVQLAGIDPYRDPPSSPALAGLREAALFGAPGHCQHAFPGGCTSINRPTVRTIYPPVAEGAFTLVRVLSFGGQGEHLPLQLAAVLGSLVIGWLLLRWASARGRPWLAAVWAWCPIVVVEYANNAHIDWLAVLLVVLALATSAARRPGLAGALVGAAIAVKLYPALVLPALMRRHPFAAVGSALGLVVLVYVPHVVAVGSAVIGYLPGYLKEENYSSGKRLLLLGEVLPHPADTIVGVVIVGAVALWAWLRAAPEHPERSAVVVVGVAFAVFTPSYGWYTGLLVALVAMTGAVEWTPLAFAAVGAYLVHADHDTLIYAFAAAAVALIAGLRLLLDQHARGRSVDLLRAR